MQEVPEEDDCMLLGDEQSEFFLCIHVVGFHLARKSYRNNHPIFMIYSSKWSLNALMKAFRSNWWSLVGLALGKPTNEAFAAYDMRGSFCLLPSTKPPNRIELGIISNST